MSHRKHAKHTPTTDDHYDDRPARPSSTTWIVYAVAMLLVGGLAGYVLSIAGNGGAPAATTASTAAAPAPVSAAPAAGMVDEVALKAYRDILARDPKNVQAAVKRRQHALRPEAL